MFRLVNEFLGNAARRGLVAKFGKQQRTQQVLSIRHIGRVTSNGSITTLAPIASKFTAWHLCTSENYNHLFGAGLMLVSLAFGGQQMVACAEPRITTMDRRSALAQQRSPVACEDMSATHSKDGKAVFGGGLGFGKKCAVIVVDFVGAYTTEGSALYCPGKGFGVVDAVDASVPLLELARSRGVPIFYTQPIYRSDAAGGVFAQKVPILKTFTPDNALVQVDARVTPAKGDTVFEKEYPSAFFGTPLASNLRALQVDTCIVVGCSTSGCIRATVLDGCCHGFRCIVPRECVGDRTEPVHEANLFDMNAKNGDVLPKEMVMAHLRSAPSPSKL